MASVNKTRPHCVNQMGKTHYKALAARHGQGIGKAWARHVMCESALKLCDPLLRQTVSHFQQYYKAIFNESDVHRTVYCEIFI